MKTLLKFLMLAFLLWPVSSVFADDGVCDEFETEEECGQTNDGSFKIAQEGCSWNDEEDECEPVNRPSFCEAIGSRLRCQYYEREFICDWNEESEECNDNEAFNGPVAPVVAPVAPVVK